MNLRDEGPANKISRRQGVIKMKSDTEFYLRNLGQRPFYVNGQPVRQSQRVRLNHASVIEACGLCELIRYNKHAHFHAPYYRTRHMYQCCPHIHTLIIVHAICINVVLHRILDIHTHYYHTHHIHQCCPASHPRPCRCRYSTHTLHHHNYFLRLSSTCHPNLAFNNAHTRNSHHVIEQQKLQHNGDVGAMLLIRFLNCLSSNIVCVVLPCRSASSSLSLTSMSFSRRN